MLLTVAGNGNFEQMGNILLKLHRSVESPDTRHMCIWALGNLLLLDIYALSTTCRKERRKKTKLRLFFLKKQFKILKSFFVLKWFCKCFKFFNICLRLSLFLQPNPDWEQKESAQSQMQHATTLHQPYISSIAILSTCYF
jgi:hypothetical protein